MTNGSISSRQASELLGVHESSIKRWCNSGELGCWLTPGGHRRISVSVLSTFAREKGIEAPIAAFGSEAERTWIGIESARTDDFVILSRLFFEWMERLRSDLIERLILFLLEMGFGAGTIFDRVFADAMRRVGSGYESRDISIGDEHRMTQAARDALAGVRRVLDKEFPEDPDQPTAVVGCARSENHEMGALVIRLILRRHGWRVLYLGADVPTEEFQAQQEKYEADLVCVSMSPMKGDATALQIIQLLDRLGGKVHPFRLAVGGVALEEGTRPTDGSGLIEARLFRSAASFEEWILRLAAEDE